MCENGLFILETDDPSRRTWAKKFRLYMNAGKQVDHPSRRTICVVRLFRRTCSRSLS